MTTRKDIENGLRRIGLAAGDTVVMHSSLSCFGHVRGGAAAVVDAVLEVLGPGGTLVVPTFNYAPGVFDPVETRSLVGAITEEVRRRPDAVRSLHPTHSVAAIGSLSRIITEGHDRTTPFGHGSALFNVLQITGSKILQLGVTHTSNSIVHVAEEIAGVPYLERTRQVRVRKADGRVMEIQVRRPGCSQGFGAIEDILQQRHAVSQTMIGECCSRLMSARAVVDAAIELIANDAEGLLCSRPECEVCAESRAMIAAMRVEEQDREITQMAEEDERTIRVIQRQLGDIVEDFDPDHRPSPN